MRSQSGHPPIGDRPGRWLIDRYGGWLEVATHAANCPEDRVDVRIFARIVDIHWNVDLAPGNALISVVEWLRRLPPARQTAAALRFRYGAWNSEVFDTPEDAARRILTVLRYAGTQAFTGITRKQLGLSRAYDGRPLIAQTVETWLRMGGQLDTRQFHRLNGVIQHSLLFRQVANGDHLVYAYAGRKSAAAEIFGPTWSDAVIGRAAQDCWSDDDYEDAVCADFTPVMERDEARYDHFRAFFAPPGSEPIWLNYERLLLPWEADSGERLLMVLSARSQDLVIPFLESDTP